MPNYISSNANRFYVATEASYGQAAPVTSANRFPAVRLQAQQILETGKRLDKTGTRTFLGSSKNGRRHTAFQVANLSDLMDGVCGAFVRSTVSRCARRLSANQ
jgi:hypothetical protein